MKPTNRRNPGIYLPNEMVDCLEAIKAETGTPVSRIIEKAVAEYLKNKQKENV